MKDVHPIQCTSICMIEVNEDQRECNSGRVCPIVHLLSYGPFRLLEKALLLLARYKNL